LKKNFDVAVGRVGVNARKWIEERKRKRKFGKIDKAPEKNENFVRRKLKETGSP